MKKKSNEITPINSAMFGITEFFFGDKVARELHGRKKH